MALNQHELAEIFSKIQSVHESPVKVLSLGYPDLLISKREVIELLGEKVSQSVLYREDSQAIIDEHNWSLDFHELPESLSLFKAMGAELVTFDIQKHRGHEIIVDLNEPIEPQWINQFHLVLDPGTLEHCFNIAQAIKNYALCCKTGGWIFHQNPYSYANHGFYSISPEFYYCFYQSNGFQIESFKVEGWSKHPLELREIRPEYQCHRVWVQKQTAGHIVFPIQGVYDTTHKSPDNIFSYLQTNQFHHVGLWPASTVTQKLLNLGLKDKVRKLSVFDMYKANQFIEDIVIQSPDQLTTVNPDCLLITSYCFGGSIKQMAQNSGYPKSKITLCF